MLKPLISVLLLLLLAAQVWAPNSDVDLSVSPSHAYVRSGQNFGLSFSIQNLADDDNEIDFIDLYLLDLSSHNLSVSSWSGTDWTYEHIAAFDDEHFALSNAVDQSLSVTLNLAGGAAEGQENVVCYFQFSDSDGSETGLGDNMPLLPLDDATNHYCFYVTADNTPPVIDYVHVEGYDLTGPVSLFDGVSFELMPGETPVL